MRKNLVIGAISIVMLSSCGTYAGAGASLGSIFGGAIGGIAGGGRGSDIGTIVGMAGGAAIGAAADNARQKRQTQGVYDHYDRVQRSKQRDSAPYSDDSRRILDDTYNVGTRNLTSDSLNINSSESSRIVNNRIYNF